MGGIAFTMSSLKRVPSETFPPRTTRLLWAIFIAVLALVVLAQIWVHPHPHFGMDGEFWFYPVYGLLASMGLVLLSKVLGNFLKRPDSYWEEEEK